MNKLKMSVFALGGAALLALAPLSAAQAAEGDATQLVELGGEEFTVADDSGYVPVDLDEDVTPVDEPSEGVEGTDEVPMPEVEGETIIIDEPEDIEEQAPVEETPQEEVPPTDEEGEGETPVDEVTVVTLEAPTKIAGECRPPMAPQNAVKVDVRTPGAVQYYVNGVGVNTTDGFIPVYDYQVTVSAVAFYGYAIDGAPEGFIEWPTFEFPYKECGSDIVWPPLVVDEEEEQGNVAPPVVTTVTPAAPATPAAVVSEVSTPKSAAHPAQLAVTGSDTAVVNTIAAATVVIVAGALAFGLPALRRRARDESVS